MNTARPAPYIVQPGRPPLDHDPSLAHVATQLSELAYLPLAGGGLPLALAETVGYRLVTTIADRGTEAFVAQDQLTGALWVSYRGTTKEGSDILADLKVRRRPASNGGTVHRGFRDYAAKAYPALWVTLEQLDPPRLYFTGHSLGAAGARIAAGNVPEPFARALCPVYTFGCPKIGDEEFDQALPVPHFHYVNGPDIVPRVPLYTMGYSDPGTTMIYRRSDGITVENPNQLVRWSDFLLALPSLPGRLSARLTAHRIRNYVDWTAEEAAS